MYHARLTQNQSKKFFNLPEEVKALAPHPTGGSHHRGYSGIGVEKVIQSGQDILEKGDIEALRAVPDYKESFEIGNVRDELQPNIWLSEDEIPGFREYVVTLSFVFTAFVFLETRANAVRLLDSWSHSSLIAQLWSIRF